MQENGLRPLAGINADYFSFKTGIPMGYTIADGEIISKEYGGQDAVGFRSDGTGFIKWLDIQTTVTDGEKSIDVMYINKWCQAGFDPVYLLTDKFGKTTKTQSECIFVICTPNEGRLHVDETMSLTVDDVFIYNGEIEIPEGKVVLLMDTSGVSEYYDFLSRLHAGQTLTVANQAVGDDGTWKTAENAVSSVGGRLVTNGVANSNFEAGAAPRDVYKRQGQIDSKFGVALENGEAFEIIEKASKMSNVKVNGVHCHIGSQIFDIEPFCKAAEIMMNFVGDLKDKLGLEIDNLNLGGGYGIMYTENDDPVPYDEYIQHVSEVVKATAEKRGVKLPFILMEPGRSIIAPAGITLYTVGGIKDIKNVRKYVSVDGGMGDNPRYILYESEYEAVVANNANAERTEKVTVAGKCCESGDILLKDAMMPEIKVGDTLAVLATGAYNYSMASNYNRIPRAAVVAVSDGKAKVVVKRESYEDLIKNDVL